MLQASLTCFVIAISLASGECQLESDFIDYDTSPQECTKTDTAGQKLRLVFSDEFNQDGRSFKDGHDPVWTAMTLAPHSNEQLNSYSLDNIFTKNGSLHIKATVNTGSKGPPYQTAMLQSWNKFCFTGGTVEMRARLPGDAYQQGLWPAFWLMGNLGRATIQSSTDGLWPYTATKCPPNKDDWEHNQIRQQKLSACSVNSSVFSELDLGDSARGAPEIDILEVMPGPNTKSMYTEKIARKCCPETEKQITDYLCFQTPFISTSLQLAPGFPRNCLQRPPLADANVAGCSGSCVPVTSDDWYPNFYPDPDHQTFKEIYGSAHGTQMNYEFFGDYYKLDENSEMQTDAISANSNLPASAFDDFQVYRLEHKTGPKGFLKFYLNDDFLFKIEAADINRDMVFTTESGKNGTLFGRKIPDEPMYMILNVDLSSKWGWPSCDPKCPESSCCNDCQDSVCTTCFLPSFVNPGPPKYVNTRDWLAKLCTQLEGSKIEKPSGTFEIDYIRIYQPEDQPPQVGCNPPLRRTNTWINRYGKSYLQPESVEVLQEITHGGGQCSNNTECGRINGTCLKGSCVCDGDVWTGPHCMVKSTNWTRTCRYLQSSPDCNVDDVGESPLSYEELEKTLDRMCNIFEIVHKDACENLRDFHSIYFDCTLKQKTNYLLAKFLKATKDRQNGKCCNKLGRSGYCTNIEKFTKLLIYLVVSASILSCYLVLWIYLNTPCCRSCSHRRESEEQELPIQEERQELKKKLPQIEKINNKSDLHKAIEDYMKYLEKVFGFQKDSVILQIRHAKGLFHSNIGVCEDVHSPTSVALCDSITRTHRKLLSGYTKWLQHLGLERSRDDGVKCLRMGTKDARVFQVQECCLFLLCWAEASCIRHMPEFMAFVYHCARHHDPRNNAETKQENKQNPIYKAKTDHYLDHVITPIYEAIRKHIQGDTQNNSENAVEKNYALNYDDCNEFFWKRENISEKIKFKENGNDQKMKFFPPLEGLEANGGESYDKYYTYLQCVNWYDTLQSKTHYEMTGWYCFLKGYHRVALIHLLIFGVLVSGKDYIWQMSVTDVYNALVAPVLLDFIVSLYDLVVFIQIRCPRDGCRVSWNCNCNLFECLRECAVPLVYFFLICLWVTEVIGLIPEIGLVFGGSLIMLSCTLLFRSLPSEVVGGVVESVFGRTLDDKIKSEPGKWVLGFLFWIVVFVVVYFLSNPLGKHAFESTRELFHFADNSAKLTTDVMLIYLHLMLYWVTIFISFIVQTRLIAVLVTSVVGFVYAKYMEMGVSIRRSFRWCGEDCNDDSFQQLPLRFMRNILGNDSVVDPDLAAQRREFRKTWNDLILKSLHKDHQIDKEEKSKLAMGDGDGYDQWELREAMIPNLRTEEAKRRLEFFTRSSKFCAKRPLKVRNMPYFTVLVPHYKDPIAMTPSDLGDGSCRRQVQQIFNYHRKEADILDEHLGLTNNDNSEENPPSQSTSSTVRFQLIPFTAEIPATVAEGKSHEPKKAEKKGTTETDDNGKNAVVEEEPETFNVETGKEAEEEKNPEEKRRDEYTDFASMRFQSLYRTVKGMLRYHEALKFRDEKLESGRVRDTDTERLPAQSGTDFREGLEQSGTEEKSESGRVSDTDAKRPSAQSGTEDTKHTKHHPEEEDRGDSNQIKQDSNHIEQFQLLVSMQCYGQNGDLSEREKTIRELIKDNRCLEIAYITKKEKKKVVGGGEYFFSCLLVHEDKARKFPPDEDIDNRITDYSDALYSIRLPGRVFDLGGGKAANQNHALAFSTGSCIQTIDANQEFYEEEAFKLPNILSEFQGDKIAILGLREHIFSTQIGTMSDFAGRSELVFGTMVQRVLNLQMARLHYGHPDIFDKMKTMQIGGLSAASKINLNEDIFAGMNALLRGERVNYVEYMQMGKARDMGFVSIMTFQSKLGRGAALQASTRQHVRLGSRLPLSRMLSVFYGHLGYYVNQYLFGVAFWLLCFFLMYFTLSDYSNPSSTYVVGSSQLAPGQKYGSSYESIARSTLAKVCGPLLYLFLFANSVPAFLTAVLEKGIFSAIWEVVVIQNITLAPLFFSFQSRLIGYTFKTQLSSGSDSSYEATGRGLQMERRNFAELYCFYAESHLIPGFEILLMILTIVIVKAHRGNNPQDENNNIFWALVSITLTSWFIAPFLFNPEQFEIMKIMSSIKEHYHWLLGYQQRGAESWGLTRREFLEKSTKSVQLQRVFSLFALSFLLGFLFGQRWVTLDVEASIGGQLSHVTHADVFYWLVIIPCEPFGLELILNIIKFCCNKCGETKKDEEEEKEKKDGEEEKKKKDGKDKKKKMWNCIGQEGYAFLSDFLVGSFVWILVFLLWFLGLVVSILCITFLFFALVCKDLVRNLSMCVCGRHLRFPTLDSISLCELALTPWIHHGLLYRTWYDQDKKASKKLEERLKEIFKFDGSRETPTSTGNQDTETEDKTVKFRVCWAVLYSVTTVSTLAVAWQVPIFKQQPSILFIGFWCRHYLHQLCIYGLSLLLNNSDKLLEQTKGLFCCCCFSSDNRPGGETDSKNEDSSRENDSKNENSSCVDDLEKPLLDKKGSEYEDSEREND